VNLAELQARFHALAVGAVGEDEAPALAGALLRGGGPGPAARAATYASMYDARLAEALAADYPKLAALLGHERLHGLAWAYARAHPSDDPDLGRFGRRLAGFLAAHPAPDRPDLADLAALEWARSEVLVEADAVPVGRGELAALGPERFGEARLRLVPALRRLVLAHDAAAVWRSLEAGEAAPPSVARAAHLAVWRGGFDVFHAEVSAPEAAALGAAAAGATLGEVLAAFEGPGAVEAGFAALASWLDEGWVAGVEG
jgi:hypothetical protein